MLPSYIYRKFARHLNNTISKNLYNCAGRTDILFRNLSSYRGGYQPKLKITLNGSNTIQIINHSNEDKVFEFKD